MQNKDKDRLVFLLFFVNSYHHILYKAKLNLNYDAKCCNGLYVEFRQSFAKETFSYDEHLKS